MTLRFALAMLIVVCVSPVTRAAAPGAPQNLSAAVSGNTVTLTWVAPSTGGVPTGYLVQAALSPGGPVIASLPVSDTTLVVTDVPTAVYYVHVTAINIDGSSSPSNEVIVAVPGGGGGCTSPPNAPTNFTASVSGNLVTLSWGPPVDGCAPTGYVVQAGSAPGLSNLAILNVGATTSLPVSAPAGRYYVRVIALNAFGGSVASVEIIVDVGSVERVTLSFDNLATVVNRSPVTTYTESDFTITATAASWVALTTFGNPAPFMQFLRRASESTLIGEVTITSGGETFSFEALDVYSSITTIPHQIIGLRNGAAVFTVSGTVPNTFGQFATVTNPQPGAIVDTVLIRLANPATACCDNPVGLDNIVLVR